jgi:glycosyltransferase involved in cell wall biosynthesis
LVTIHSVNLFPQYAAFAAATRAGVPYIVTPHGSLDPWLATNSRLAKRVTNAVWQRRMLANAAAIHFTTEEEAQLAGELTASAPHLVVPNGIDLSRFAERLSGRSFRARHLDGYDGQVVLFLGRIARKKGIDLLIEGFAAATRGADSLLVIAGPDDEALTGELSRLASTLGIAGRVRLIGPVYGQDQLAAFAAADIWALTSHTENFGNAVLEAMASGCAVLVSTEVNLARLIQEAGAGMVTGLSVDEIAVALQTLLTDPQRRNTLSARGRALARDFDWTIVAPELLAAYRDIAHQKPVAPTRRGVHGHLTRLQPQSRAALGLEGDTS